MKEFCKNQSTFLARSANLPEGLYIYFLEICVHDYSDTFLTRLLFGASLKFMHSVL